jgi:hypothetical protein
MLIFLVIILLISLLVSIVAIAGLWKCFTKAGQPGWAAIIPIYNFYVIGEISGRGGAFGIMTALAYAVCAPVGLILAIMLMIDFAKAYDQSAGFGVGLALLGFIFFPILGFGSAEYVGGSGGGGGRSRRRRDYDEDEDDRPRRRRPVDEDEDDDRPRRRRPRDDY